MRIRFLLRVAFCTLPSLPRFVELDGAWRNVDDEEVDEKDAIFSGERGLL